MYQLLIFNPNTNQNKREKECHVCSLNLTTFDVAWEWQTPNEGDLFVLSFSPYRTMTIETIGRDVQKHVKMGYDESSVILKIVYRFVSLKMEHFYKWIFAMYKKIIKW